MAKGAYYTKHLDDTLKKGIYETQVPNINFLYQTPSTTKPTGWDIGDKVVLPDGREFRLALSLGNNALFAAHGVQFTYTGYTSYTAFATNHAQGATEITIPAATHAALSTDELRGGYVIIFDGATDLNTCVRGIVGNDSADANAAFDVQLDGQIHNAIVASTEACEVYQNPWKGMEVASNSALPIAGVPTTTVSAAANYFWVQTKGICWVAPQANVGDNGGMLTMWRHDGSIESAETALAVTVPSADRSQIAGYCIQGSQAGNGPLLMLSDHG
jgi:hypothetical protein